MQHEKIECGFYRLPEANVFHYAGYECAAWWQDVKVEAGDYPVVAHMENGFVHHFHVRLPGVITEDYFQSLYCGTRIGAPYDTKQQAGRPADYHISPRGYELLAALGKANSLWHIDVSKLPNVGCCSDDACGVYVIEYKGRTMCGRCRRNAEAVRLFHLNRRYKLLIAAVKKAGRRVAEAASIFDQQLDAYLESGRADGYYREQVAKAIRNLRASQHSKVAAA